MANENLEQIFTANPVTTIGDTDLLYVGEGGTTDAAIDGASLKAQFQQVSTAVTSTEVQSLAFNTATDTGSADDYTVDLSPAVVTLTDGLIIVFTPANNNTLPNPVINVNTHTNIPIRISDSNTLVSGDLSTNFPAILQYSLAETEFTLLNPVVSTVTPYDIAYNSFIYYQDDGSANAYDLGNGGNNYLTEGYTDGAPVYFVPVNANTGASTINVNSIGVVDIFNLQGTALVGGEMLANGIGYFLLFSSVLNGFVLQNSSLASGGSSPWTAGSGTGSAIGGDGTSTTSGDYSLSYGQSNTSSNFADHSFNMGSSNSITNSYAFCIGLALVCSGENSFSFGANGGSTGLYSFSGGNDCVAGGRSGFAFGTACTTTGNYSVAWGNTAISNNAGSWVIGDSNASPNQDTAANQFNATFAGGYKFWGGSFAVQSVGSGLAIAEGSNAKQGVVTLVSGVGVVSNTSVTANSRIFYCAQDTNTIGYLTITARSAGSGFTITSSSLTDSGVVAYELFEPA